MIFPRLLDVNQLAANRQNRLVTPIAPLFRGAAGRIALDNIKLGQFRIALRAIGQFSRQPAASERTLTNRFARFACCFTCARGRQNFFENAPRDRRVLVEEGHQTFVNRRIDDAVDLGVHKFHLGLRFEPRVGQFDAEHADQTFPNVIARNGWVLFFQELILLRVLIDCFGQRCPKSSEMRTAVRIWNRIGERQNLIVVGVVVLQDNIDKHFVALPRNHDRLRMQDLFVFAELLYELLDAVLVEKCFLLWGIAALVGEIDLKAGI